MTELVGDPDAEREVHEWGHDGPLGTDWRIGARPARTYRLRQIVSMLPNELHHNPDHQAARLVAKAQATGFDALRRFEYRRPDDDDPRAGFDDAADVVELHAAVDLQLDREMARVDLPPQALELADRTIDELLPAESGIDAHDQSDIDLGEIREDRVDRSGGVERDARLRAAGADAGERRGDLFRAEGEEFSDAVGGIVDHQANVERERGLDALRDRRSEAQIRHEVTVHHVDVHPVRSAPFERAHGLRQPGEVGTQDRRSESRFRNARFSPCYKPGGLASFDESHLRLSG